MELCCLLEEKESNIKTDPPGCWWNSWPPSTMDLHLSSGFQVAMTPVIILGDFRVHTDDSPSTHDLPCLSCLLVSSELALCSTLVTLVVRTCHLIFWSLSTILPAFFVDSPTSVIPQHFGDIHTVCNPTVLFVCLAMPSVPHVLTCPFKFHGAST